MNNNISASSAHKNLKTFLSRQLCRKWMGWLLQSSHHQQDRGKTGGPRMIKASVRYFLWGPTQGTNTALGRQFKYLNSWERKGLISILNRLNLLYDLTTVGSISFNWNIWNSILSLISLWKCYLLLKLIWSLTYHII